jgi:hypothetical protein
MQTIIKEFAKDGVKTEPEIDEEIGWAANDQPAAEDWNYIQNVRDAQQIGDADARAVREFGINPSILRGNYDNKIPAFRPNAFDGKELLWDPESPYNMPSLSVSDIAHATLGWDPSLKMPVLAVIGEMSVPGTSVDIDFIHCWDYDNAPVTTTTRSVSIGFATTSTSRYNIPILICDGYLYLVVEQETTLNRIILRYDLANWTGSPDKTLDVSDYVSLDGLFCTDLVELSYVDPGDDETWSNMYCGLFAQRRADKKVYFCRFRKDLEDFVVSSAGSSSVGGSIDRICRTDGDSVFTVGTAGAPPLVQILVCASAADVDTIVVRTFTVDDDQKIVDILPLKKADGEDIAGAAALIHRDSAPYGPYIQVLLTPGSSAIINDTFHFDDGVDDTLQFDYSVPGCFVTFGASVYTVLARKFTPPA